MRVYGVARQSRGDENSKSVAVQERNLREWCEREGHELVGLGSEQDVSGGRPLARRPGLKAAVDAVERGEADAIAVVYFDRLVRSTKVQAEVLERVEEAGGKVVTLDLGEVGQDTAVKWLASQNMGMMAEFYRRLASERGKANRAEHRRNGTFAGGKVPIGLAVEDGRLVPGEHAPAVLDAYEMRDHGVPIAKILDHLRGVTGMELRSLNIVQRLLRNPIYLELGVVPPALHRRVSGLVAPRGKQPKSNLLLARLGVLRCGTCGARMVSATATGPGGARVPVYRCPPNNPGCHHRQAITASIAEDAVVHAARVALREAEGRTGADTQAAEAEVARAERAFSATVEAFDGFADVAAVREKMATLRAELAEAEDALDRARRSASFTLTTSGESWDELTVMERRDLIRATIESAEVMPGRGKERIKITLAPELAEAQRVLDRAASSFRDDLAS